MREKNRNSQSHAKTPNTTSRKKLNNSLFSNRNHANYNSKDLADKLCLINFSSMPSTPTGNTFIKKLGEKVGVLNALDERAQGGEGEDDLQLLQKAAFYDFP